MCAAITALTYTIVAEPVLNVSGRLETIRLKADRPEISTKEWDASPDNLITNLSDVIGRATTHEVLECLRCGQTIRLPGVYKTYEVVQLGYRAIHTTMRKQRVGRLVGLFE